MLLNDILPDHYTAPSVLKACAQCRALREGQQIHAYAIKSGLVLSNVYVNNTIMRLYAVCGFMNYARKMFDESPQRDLVSWTTLIQGYVKMGYAREGVEAFFDMCDAKMRPDEMTLVIVLSACSKLGDLSLGRKISRYIDDNGVNPDVFIGNALVNMYLECGDDELARGVFDGMPVRNVVSWNAMILGLAHQGKYKEALDVFQEMQRTGLEPDDVTLVGVLNSCANLGVLELGKWVHAYVDRNQTEADGYIGNALVDMYAKCGSIDRAFRCVSRYETKRCIFVYCDDCWISYAWGACSHGGLVAEGQKYFRDMSTVYMLRPQTEHYGCMVDLLGRAGLIDEAVEFVNTMPIEPDAFVWGALLGACRIHGKVELAEAVMEKLLKVEPERDGAYVLMSNIYSSANKWRDAVQLRRTMKEKKMKKTPGCSSIEVEGVVHEFRKGDKSHKRSKHIYKLLDEIMSHINDYGVLAHRSTLL
ncbi:hypothetical protein ACLB2K_077176 [Fragaria x ananassa]